MKNQQVQHTTSSACPTDSIGLPYSPALLLDVRLDVSITDHPEFSPACQQGFEVARVVMREDVAIGTFPYSCSVFTDFVRDNLLCEGSSHLVLRLAYSVGYVLGGLSALACSQYQEAQEGLHELTRLLDCAQDSQSWPPRRSRSVDSAGWPLDL